ncbi:CsbD family protein [Streptomyces lydicus]|uniref:CsbD family protein n=1 Tax=Streptomyces lydicus TaxID=47763 RepID=UPI0036F9EAE0
MGIGKKSKNLGDMTEGKTNETAGKALDDRSLEGKGKAEKAKGKVKQAVERGKHSFKH